MSERITNQEARNMIESEGFDYFFRFYAAPTSFADERLVQLAKAYVKAADALDKFLPRYAREEE